MATAETMRQFFNQALTTREFPSNPKKANVTPLFLKKNNPLSKENDRPVSVLPIILKSDWKVDTISNKFTRKIFFVAIPVCLQKGL